MSFLDQVTKFRISRDKCNVCRRIRFAYSSSGKKYYSENLGKIGDLRRMKCPVHPPLIEYLVENTCPCDKHGTHTEEQDEMALEVSRSVWSTSIGFHAEAIDHTDHRFSFTPLLEVMERTGKCGKPRFGFGQVLNKRWIDSSKLLKWYSNCKKDHRSTCDSPEYLTMLSRPRPQYFIDTMDRCLVLAESNTPYVALSYVWGQVDCLKTTSDIVRQLQQPDALEKWNNTGKIPKTVLDAMNLLSLINERYLWVDTLCIVQDDKPAMAQQLQMMASIFAHAELVIVAADGEDSEYGLRGIQELPDSIPRNLEQTIIPFGKEKFVTRIFHKSNDRYFDKQPKKYFRRGWTFQEYMYARRRLVFEKESVCCECRCSTMFEDLKHVTERAPWNHEYIEFFYKNGSPSLTVYLKMINLINDRDFTYPEDILSSFAGTTTTLLHLFTGGMLCGLPEMFFDVALLWQPEKQSLRRLPRRGQTENGNGTSSLLPSWSWVGWHGLICGNSWATGTDFAASSRGLIAHTAQSTIPITTWYTAAQPDSEKRRKIEVVWAEWRERYKNEKEPLPKGWRRIKYKPGSRRGVEDYLSPDGYGKCLFKHESTDFDFWYPIPLRNPDPDPKPRPTTQYIFGKVQSTYLSVSLDVPKQYNICISLLDREGRWAGALRLHHLSDVAQIRDELQKSENGVKLQLVAISRGSTPANEPLISEFVRHGYDLGPKIGDKYQFYNVLWIEWENQIAYRKALGRVNKSIWEAQDLETMDLVLG
jgi:heterokaryon incompatibility protein (HET)